MQIQVEESALDSIKRMAQQLQEENTLLIKAIFDIATEDSLDKKEELIFQAYEMAVKICREPEEIIEKQKEAE